MRALNHAYRYLLTLLLRVPFVRAALMEASDDLVVRSHFEVPCRQDSTGFLRGFIRDRRKLLRSSAKGHWQIHLDLADANHWLGHLAEGESRLTVAEKAHKLSKKHYALSGIKTSNKINRLTGEKHANYHLTRVRIAGQLRRGSPGQKMPGFKACSMAHKRLASYELE